MWQQKKKKKKNGIFAGAQQIHIWENLFRINVNKMQAQIAR